MRTMDHNFLIANSFLNPVQFYLLNKLLMIIQNMKTCHCSTWAKCLSITDYISSVEYFWCCSEVLLIAEVGSLFKKIGKLAR